MSGNIVRAHNWDLGWEQRFLAVNPLGDEVLLYQTNHEDPGIGYNELNKISSRGGFDNIQCSSYAYNSPGLTGVGTINGTVHIFDMLTTNSTILKLRPKQNRPCNSISFNNNGWISVCFDKGRQDNSLQLWNIGHYSRTSDNDHIKRPTYSYLPNEAVLSTCFIPGSDNDLLAGSYKLLRQFDIRSDTPSFQVATKCTLGITFDHFQPDCYFSTYSEDGSLAIWDRRKLSSSSAKLKGSSNTNVMTESPVLQFNKLLSDSSRKNHNPCFRYSSVRRGEFSSVFNGVLIRRWHTGSVPAISSSQLQDVKNSNISNHLKPSRDGHIRVPSSTSISTAGGNGLSAASSTVLASLKNQSSQLYKPTEDSLFVSLVLDCRTDYERVISFDYSPDINSSTSTNFVCMRQSGSVFRMKTVESIESLDFNSYNEFAMVGPEGSFTQLVNDQQIYNVINKPRNVQNVNNGTPENGIGVDNSKHNSVTPSNGHFDDYDDFRRDSEAEYSEDINSTVGDDESTSAKYRSDDHLLRTEHRHSSHTFRNSQQLQANDGGFINDLVSLRDVLDVSKIIGGDTCFSIRKRALAGYGVDCEQNIDVLERLGNLHNKLFLRNTWKWIALAQKSLNKGTMISQGLDLGFQGVLGIWKGVDEIKGEKRYQGTVTYELYHQAVKSIVSSKGKKTASINIPSNSEYKAQRKLCLIVSGWYFTDDEFEERLNLLISLGFTEKAAGWAVFHGDVDRAIKILASSKKEKLNLISTAVAGYSAYKTSNVNSPWKDQCRKMASDLSDPYLRAIFAFIADNDWWDVLDEHSLPLRERLGIALRFLSDKDLTVYLNRVADTVIAKGELEGLILTGITPRGIDLLQSYVDRTSDVQTVALMTAYGVPRYFRDVRVDHWIDCYRSLLNSWGLFNTRAKFDVARAKLSKTSNGQLTIRPEPKQVYLQCIRCNKNISASGNDGENGVTGGISSSSDPTSNSGNNAGPNNNTSILIKQFNKLHMRSQDQHQDINACPHCGAPLPRCSICLLTLGTPTPAESSEGVDETTQRARIENKFRDKFSFCLSCNHGAHAYHAEEWFSKHYVCPVPDCNCRCNSK